MFNAEKLLGGILGSSMSKGLGKDLGKGFGGGLARSLGKGSIGGGGKAAIGLGVLGIALAAAEHFMQERQSPAPSASSPPPRPSLPPQAPASVQAPPPPPPASAPAAHKSPDAAPPPPPPEIPGSATAPEQNTAVLLIRAMIASAHADGVLDAEERSRIMGQLEELGLDDEERNFMERELQTPRSAEEIAKGAGTAQVARQVFAASLLAVDVDTPEEETYLLRLKSLLNLSDEDAGAIARELGF